MRLTKFLVTSSCCTCCHFKTITVSDCLQLLEQFGNVWHPSRVRKYLTQDDWSPTETKGRPWFGLLALLRKYPEHFVINTRSKGRMTSEFVSLVSLLS